MGYMNVLTSCLQYKIEKNNKDKPYPEVQNVLYIILSYSSEKMMGIMFQTLFCCFSLSLYLWPLIRDLKKKRLFFFQMILMTCYTMGLQQNIRNSNLNILAILCFCITFAH